jgi:glycosyltransferase involved in cell wall biosynthesis
LRPELEAQANALGLGDRFVFGGFTRDVARTVSAFDISVFPSLWEGTPLTVFEALAMGKAIVATDADGLVDVLTNEHDALIVPKRDSAALAAAMVRLIDSPEDRARLSVHARVTGRQYDIAAFVRKMEQLYDLLHRVSRSTKRRGALEADLSFLTDGARPERSRGTSPEPGRGARA